MPLTETGVIGLAGVHERLPVTTGVPCKTDPMANHRRQLVPIPIEEILVMRCVHLPQAEVTDLVPRDHQGIRDLLLQQEAPEVLVM
jgi:hypothetical protein